MSAKLQQHQQHHQQQHLKVDSNVASFGGTVTTTVSSADGTSLRSVEKNAVLTERQLTEGAHARSNNLLHQQQQLAAAGSDASLDSSGTGDSATGDSSAASIVSSGVSTDSVELVGRHQQFQQLQQLQQQQQQQKQQQQQRFASLLTVERAPAAWASHAHVTFRYRSDRLYYLDSAGRLHGPMDQREQCQVASVRRHTTRSSEQLQQPPVAIRSHRTVQGGGGGTAGLDDGLLLLEHRFTSSHSQQQQQRQLSGAGGGGGGGVYSRVQVNQYDDWSSAPIPRSYSQQLEYGDGQEFRYRRAQSRDGHHNPQHLQQHQLYQRSTSHHHHHHHGRGHQPGFDTRLEQLERSLNQAMESIRRQTSSSSQHRQRQQHRQHRQQQQHQYIEQQRLLQGQDTGGELRRFNSEPPFEFRYSQRTMTHEPPQVTEEVETTTLQPIGRGIHDLGGGVRVTVQQQQQQQQHTSVTEHRVTRASRLAVRGGDGWRGGGDGGGGGRSLSANRNATLRASTPVSPKLTVQQPQPAATAGSTRGRHLSANTPREFAQVY